MTWWPSGYIGKMLIMVVVSKMLYTYVTVRGCSQSYPLIVTSSYHQNKIICPRTEVKSKSSFPSYSQYEGLSPMELMQCFSQFWEKPIYSLYSIALAKGVSTLYHYMKRNTCKKYFHIGLLYEKEYLQKYLSHWTIVWRKVNT